MFFRGGARDARTAKRVSKSWETGKTVSKLLWSKFSHYIPLYVERIYMYIGKLRQRVYINFVEVGPCDLLRVSFSLPFNPRLGWFSTGDSRASGTAPPPPLPHSRSYRFCDSHVYVFTLAYTKIQFNTFKACVLGKKWKIKSFSDMFKFVYRVLWILKACELFSLQPSIIWEM